MLKHVTGHPYTNRESNQSQTNTQSSNDVPAVWGRGAQPVSPKDNVEATPEATLGSYWAGTKPLTSHSFGAYAFSTAYIGD